MSNMSLISNQRVEKNLLSDSVEILVLLIFKRNYHDLRCFLEFDFQYPPNIKEKTKKNNLMPLHSQNCSRSALKENEPKSTQPYANTEVDL